MNGHRHFLLTLGITSVILLFLCVCACGGQSLLLRNVRQYAATLPDGRDGLIVEGMVENATGKSVPYIGVSVVFYDAAGDVVTTARGACVNDGLPLLPDTVSPGALQDSGEKDGHGLQNGARADTIHTVSSTCQYAALDVSADIPVGLRYPLEHGECALFYVVVPEERRAVTFDVSVYIIGAGAAVHF